MVVPPTVYILDDDAAVRRSMTRLMHSAGFEAQSFASVVDFLALKQFEAQSCVIADIRMPGGSGLTLPALLLERNEHVPVIILTAVDSESLRSEAYAAGVVSFFRKPVDDQALIDAIEWALGGSTHDRKSGKQNRR